jgi:hypothetical protein
MGGVAATAFAVGDTYCDGLKGPRGRARVPIAETRIQWGSDLAFTDGRENELASKARLAFNTNCADVKRLLEIHGELGGSGQGRRYGLEVINKSAIVLICAIWEAYCEDVAAEGLAHLVKHAKSADDLPETLRKAVAVELKGELHELAIWQLSGDGWRTLLSTRLAALQEERNRKLNTPKSNQIDELFERALGITKISNSWTWDRTSAEQARKKLDKYVTLRGDIAHRGQSVTSSCRKKDVEDFFEHIGKLVGKTGGQVNTMLKKSTGTSLW